MGRPLNIYVVDDSAVWGRPVGVAVAHDGALLVTEDGDGTLFDHAMVTYGSGLGAGHERNGLHISDVDTVDTNGSAVGQKGLSARVAAGVVLGC